MTNCLCGCGTEIPDGRRFVRGHNRALHRPGRAPVTNLLPCACACGCGGTIEPHPKHRYRVPAFLKGHKSTGHVRYQPRPEEIPSGRCECGCGGMTSVARYTERAKRYFRGHPVPRLSTHSPKRFGAANHSWRGGRFLHVSGYVYVLSPEHPYANARGYVFEHRLVLERVLGRYLTPDEVGHHRNEIRSDNRPENLAFMTRGEHSREHHRDGVRRPATHPG